MWTRSVMSWYYCTAGRGTELFVETELRSKLKPFKLEEVCVTDGKVFLKVDCLPRNLVNLKTVERVFLVVANNNYHRNHHRGAEYCVRPRCYIAKETLWTNSRTMSNLLDIYSMKTPVNDRPPKGGGACLKLINNSIKTIETKQRTKHNSIDSEPCSSVRDQEHSMVDSAPELEQCMDAPLPVVDVSDFNNKDTSVLPPVMTDKGHTRDTPFGGRIRVNCRCCSRVAEEHRIDTEFIQHDIGKWLKKSLKWTVNLRSPDIEINIVMEKSRILVGVPITRKPLSRREYIKHFGLRSTVSYIMTSLLQLKIIVDSCLLVELYKVNKARQLILFKPGDIVLDPMCGKGTILTESAYEHKSVLHIGCDIDPDQLKFAEENISHANLHNVMLFRSNASNLPLQDHSIDCMVCDAPFGLNYTINEDNINFYQTFLKEACRVLKPGGKIVLLTIAVFRKYIIKEFSSIGNDILAGKGRQSHTDTDCCSTSIQSNIHTDYCHTSMQSKKRSIIETSSPVKKQKLNNEELSYINSHYVKLGDTDAYICQLIKTIH